MTTTALRIDLMLPAMGMKLFTSHRRTPTTIRAKRICMRGILFYLSVFAAGHFYTAPTNFCMLCLARKRVESLQFNEGLDYRSRQVVRFTCCSMSSALVRVGEIKLKKMDWPTQQSF
jgi:hypothetical protein